jgi:hypothetical protein
MEEDNLKEIEEVINRTNCQKNYICLNHEFDYIYNVELFGFESGALECFRKEPSDCGHSLRNGDKYQCMCPFRNYIAQQYGN